MSGAMFNNFGSAYQSLVKSVREHGVQAAPRGQRVLELRWPHMWHISNASQWMLFIPNRRLNVFFALAEVVWMWSGKGGAEFISFYNKSITQFLDGDIPYFHGSYGRRVRHAGYDEYPFRTIPSNRTQPASMGSIPVEVDQIEHVVRKIRTDPHTRQAVISLWDPVKDNMVASKDHPCNNMLYFQQRDGALNMTVVRRSNDLILGVPYNMCQFTHLHALLAGELELEQGHYTVMANNLHVYLDLYPSNLELVMDWCFNSVPRVVSGVHTDLLGSQALPRQDTWGIFNFTAFVNNRWEPFEKTSREHIRHREVGAINSNPFYEMQFIMLSQHMDRSDMPVYWRHVFTILLIFHAAKADAWTVVTHLFKDLPVAFKWQILDFWSKNPNAAFLNPKPYHTVGELLNKVNYDA